MTAVSAETVVPPSCPASPAATGAFCRAHWELELDQRRWAPTLARRERVIRSLRAAGDARAGDAVGWLSLAGLLAGLPARVVGAILGHRDPAALVDLVAMTAMGGFGPFRDEPDGPPGRYVARGGLEVIDAGSRNGWTIAELSGRASQGAVVVVDGHPMTPTAFRRLLRERLDAALERAGAWR